MIKLRKGKSTDFSELSWAWDGFEEALENCLQGIEKGTQEFWVAEEQGSVIGEIHILWNHEESQMANGSTRAYLSTFRVHPDYQGQGIGRSLFQRAIKRIQNNQFSEATIGGYSDEPALQELYKRWGFTETIGNMCESSSGTDRSCIILLRTF